MRNRLTPKFKTKVNHKILVNNGVSVKPSFKVTQVAKKRQEDFIICCFYTRESQYEAGAQQVKNDCDKLGLNSYIVSYPSRGSWVQNCALKPWFLKHCLEFHKNKSILYVDADARIRQYPELVHNFEADIGVHYLHDELLSGTIILNNNQKTRIVIDKWLKLQEKYPYEWDQRVLQKILTNPKTDINVQIIPGSYCQIFDIMASLGDPIIEHFQASRNRFLK